MKPLLQHHIPTFCERFCNFEDAEFRSFEMISPTAFTITLALQDASCDFDWITLSLEFYDVFDASLIDNDKLPFVNFTEGATLEYDEGFYFQINAATFYIKSKTLKYQEGSF